MIDQKLRPAIYRNVQGARGLAALMVVAYHVGLLPFGQCGVDIFFVISGFIMSHVAPQERRRDFLAKRLIRIVPLYWISTIGVYAVGEVKPNWLHTTNASVGYLVKSLLFIPYLKADGHWGPLNLNGWTLEYELIFYLAIWGVLHVVTPRFATAAAAAALIVYSLLSACLSTSENMATYLGQPYVIEFGLGVAAYWIVYLVPQRGLFHAARMALMICAVCAIPIYFYVVGAPTGFVRVAAYGLPALALVTTLVHMEMGGCATQSVLIARLGAASYAIYLLHPFVIGLAMKVIGQEMHMTPWAATGASLIAIFVACVVGDACHLWIERPILSRVRGLFKRAETHRVGAA
ncbi:acyltransferase [Paraburkholderia jirisanensis]